MKKEDIQKYLNPYKIIQFWDKWGKGFENCPLDVGNTDLIVSKEYSKEHAGKFFNITKSKINLAYTKFKKPLQYIGILNVKIGNTYQIVVLDNTGDLWNISDKNKEIGDAHVPIDEIKGYLDKKGKFYKERVEECAFG